jgi:SAM-dependent methyltransferase
MTPDSELFIANGDGTLIPKTQVEPCACGFDATEVEMLAEMQRRHFWYAGRHRFLLHALRHLTGTFDPARRTSLSGIDLGAGCGGWIAYLDLHAKNEFRELALADTSLDALAFARRVVRPERICYQVDACRLPWHDRWDVVFLFDVLEHLDDDLGTLKEIHKTIRPGGYLLITTPALMAFWTYNDVLAKHVRRYSRRDFSRLAELSNFELRKTRYFMFFLSPLLLASRMKAPDIENMTDVEIRRHLKQTHRTPVGPVNTALTAVFNLETPLGDWIPFPWGTSILAVLRKPCKPSKEIALG